MLVTKQYWIPVFNEERTVRIYLPDTYEQTNQDYPALYMHDGQNVFEDKDAVGGRSLRLKDYLEQNHDQVIVIAIDSGANRMEEYRLWAPGKMSDELTGKSDSKEAKGRDYLDFIVRDVVPSMNATYRIQVGSNYMAGISLGGLLTVYALCCYPTVFRRGAGISSAFFRNQEKLEQYILESEQVAFDGLYLDCGDKESGEERIDRAFLKSNERIFGLLEERGSSVEFKVVKDGKHHYESFSHRVPAVMTFLLGRRGYKHS
ncbi:alpha/beta hydrolase [Pseudalkalibacillus hwajinpoensis]|uniref:alpha/beta hydrolase n=1 Tax=Guptibacillus hwajinpoensis TaxID=208199 RepID=UPI001CD6CF1C|nr:alpha/beta hydrolase-fold protein [Pseudalkalibacillus hwajinpoensis]MCA0992249.1 alpha/beta hydrolase [Pseudalkalibacillus hwajinpoensis]